MKLKPLFTVILLAFIGLICNKAAFYFFVPKDFESHFIYSIPSLYLGFCVSSLIIIVALLKIKEINIDNVGYSFLFLTSVKMIAAYFFMSPILERTVPEMPTEKMNFFIIFIYFLAIETIVTIRILNNKQ